MIKRLHLSKAILFCALLISNLKGFTQDWIWTKGNNTVNKFGIYGPLNSSFGNNNPGSRAGGATWTDNSGNLWLFGGEGYATSTGGKLSDLWKYTIGTNEWKWVKGHNGTDRYGVYGTQGVSSATVGPGARSSSVSWKDASGNLWLFGGLGFDVNSVSGSLADLWKYNVSTSEWSWIKGFNTVDQNGVYGTQGVSSSTVMPGSRSSAVGWTDASGNLWMFGGSGRAATGGNAFLNDLWKFDVTTLQWTWIHGSSTSAQGGTYGTLGNASAANTPGARDGATAWKDGSNNFWLCNGNGLDGTSQSGMLSDIWRFNTGTGQWTWIDGLSAYNQSAVYGIRGLLSSTVTPGSRHKSVSWTDASGNLILQGGVNNAIATPVVFGDVWKYNITTNNWTWIRGMNSTPAYGTKGTSSNLNDPGAGYSRMCWKDNSNNLWLFGGIGYDVSGNFSYLNELWKTSIPGSVPVANFSFNQTANVCLGSRLTVNDLSTNSPATTAYYLDGAFLNYDKNPILQDAPLIALLTAGIHTITLISSNLAGMSTPVSKTITVLPLTASTITLTPAGSTTMYVGSGQTNVSNWSPWVYTFADPLPTGVVITKVDITYDGKDQGWGGTGFPGVIHFADQQIASGALTHGWVSYSESTRAAFASYNYGGSNTLKFYFAGYSGWQGFLSNIKLKVTYEVRVCVGGTVNLSAASGGTKVWSPAITNGVNFLPAVSGVYMVTSTDPNTCVNTSTIEVNVDSPPTIVAYNGQICSGSSFMMLPEGALTYTYSGGINPVTPTVTTSYSITGRSAAGCAATNTAVVTVSVDTTPTVVVTSGPVCIGSNFTITASGASSYTNVTLSAPMSPSMVVSPTVNTNYYVIGSSASGCESGSALAAIVVNPVPAITVNSGTICAGVSFTLNPGGSVTYTYSGGPVVNPFVTTNYSVSGSNAFNCAATAVSTIVVNPLPALSIAGSTALCLGASVTQTVSGANSYAWNTGPVTNTVSLNPAVNTSYTVTGTSALGCTNTAVKAIVVNAIPIINVSSGAICAGGSYTISPTGAATYTYSSGSVVSPISTTPYSVTGTSSQGCISAAPGVLSVSVNPLPIITANNGTLCAGSPFTITPGGANTYTFLTGAAVVNPVSNATYSVIGTSNVGCVSATPALSSLTVYALPVISVNSGTTCSGDSFTLTPTGAVSYTFLSGAVVVNPPTSTNYFVVGSNSLGCVSSNTATALIAVSPLPVISVSNGTICTGKLFTLSPSGASTYTYLNGGSVVSPVTPSTYSIVGTSSVGCISSNTAVASIAVNPLPVIGVNNGTICAGSSFTITPFGANTYTFISGATMVSPTITSTYSISGTSSDGCISGSPAVSNLVVNALPSLTITGLAAVCSGSAITQTVAGANTYSWSTGSTNALITISPTTSTTYYVTGTITTTGCFIQTSKLVNTGSPPVISVNNGNVCAGNTFTMVPAGASTYTFSNGTGTVLATVSPSSNTSYYVSGTSALGCVSTASAISNVIVNAAPVIVVNNGAVCAGKIFTMTPTGANTYTYSNGSNTVIPLSNTSYSIAGTSILGCVSSALAVASVTVNSIPVVSASSGSVCSGNSSNIIPTGASTYTYANSLGLVSPWVNPLTNTNYSITGTSSQGCTSAAPAVITVSVIALPIVTVNSSTACAGTIFTIVPSGAFTYTYSTGASTLIPFGNASYSVMGTSSEGCISSTAAICSVTVLATPNVIVNSGTICASQVFTIIPGGALTYTFSSLSATVSPSSITAYSVTGTNAQGCISSNVAISNIQVNPQPTLSIIGNAVVCNGESTALIATGANSYTWNATNSGQGQTFTPTANTTYTVSGTGPNNCIGTKTIFIVVNPLPVVTLNTGTICPASNFTIVPSGANTYTYSGGSNVVAPSITTSYTVFGTDLNGCVSGTPATATVTVINTISISVSGTTLVCSGSEASLTVAGASSYTWSTGVFTNSLVTTPTINSTYTVMGSTGTCADTAFISVQVNALPSLSGSSSSSVICKGESASLSISGAHTYLWSGGETATVIVINPGITTSYTVTGIDANGCVNKTVVTQTVSDCVGIKSLQSELGSIISLYPNPNSGEFTVETSKALKMVVLNSLGQIVAERQLTEGKNKILLEEQAKGIYFIEFKNEKQNKTLRIIKQ